MSKFIIYDTDNGVYLKNGQNITDDIRYYGKIECDDGLILSPEVQIFNTIEEARQKLTEVKRNWEIRCNIPEGTFDTEYEGIEIIEVIETNYRYFITKER